MLTPNYGCVGKFTCSDTSTVSVLYLSCFSLVDNRTTTS